MSQQSKQYVYILYNEFSPYVYKIGWTSRTPEERAKEISQGTGVVGIWNVAHKWYVKDGYWLEQRIFKKFAMYRLPRSEMFHFGGYSVEQIAEQISQFINNTGESPKRAAEIAAQEYEQRKRKKKLEDERQREKYAYDAECQRIKNEINNLITTKIKNGLKNDPELNAYFWTCMAISVLIFGGIALLNDKNIFTWAIFGIILGYLPFLFKKNSKYDELINKFSRILVDDLKKLKQIKNEIESIKINTIQKPVNNEVIQKSSIDNIIWSLVVIAILGTIIYLVLNPVK